MRALATTEHPLVLFLDDVQWADGASLALLHSLLTDADTAHLMVVVAMRDAEVGPSHPINVLVSDLQAGNGARPVRLALEPLDRESIALLLTEATRAQVSEVDRLAELVTVKTGGNPFFVGEFLRGLSRDGLLMFDPDVARSTGISRPSSSATPPTTWSTW